MIGCIYKTTNLINNKIYIGQTTRVNSKIYLGSGDILRSAIKKYGKNNFKNDILGFCSSQEELDECEKVCIVVKYPKEVHVNENFVLHNPNGPAILFEDGYGQYYINGRLIPSTNFKEACSLEGFKESFMQIKNEDTKAGMLFVLRNKFGQEGVMKALGAVLFNEEVIAHKNGYLETVRLYHSTEKYSFLIDSKGNENNPYAWLELTCPSTGTKYLQNTFADFKTATEACKFHRPEGVPMDLIYMWNSAN